MTVLKAYQYRTYPTKEQKVFFDKHFGSCRFVYNYFLSLRSKAWEKNQERISGFDCKRMLPPLKQEYTWLKEINSQSLQASVLNLEAAYRRFFKNIGKYPNFHKKHGRQAFAVPQHFSIEDDFIRIPKLGTPIRVRMHRPIEGTPKTLTITRRSSGRHFVSIVCEHEPVSLPTIGNEAGIDLGLKRFAVLSNEPGKDIPHPKFFRQSEKKLAKLQRRLSRKKKGSRNRAQAGVLVARLHEKINNRRQDFLHKLSSRIIHENQVVSLEELNVKGMVRNHHLAKAISDSGWSEFARMVRYKAEWYGRTVKTIDKFFPSSKTCSVCGYVNNDLRLKDRYWQCPECDTMHDRDYNAAVNIERIGRDTSELTPAERMTAAVSVLSMRQVSSKKQEAPHLEFEMRGILIP